MSGDAADHEEHFAGPERIEFGLCLCGRWGQLCEEGKCLYCTIRSLRAKLAEREKEMKRLKKEDDWLNAANDNLADRLQAAWELLFEVAGHSTCRGGCDE